MSVPLLIENVLFDLDEIVVRHLSEPYGQVLCLRVPRTPGGRSFGVAYAELANEAGAEQVRRQLNNTSIQGYRLVVSSLPTSGHFSSTLVRGLYRSLFP